MSSVPAPGEMALQPRDAPRLFRPSSDRDWEPYRETITALYQASNLKTVMKEMEIAYSFKATLDQYKNRIAKWGLKTKNVKAGEYQAMLKHIRRRQKTHPNRQTQFVLHGKPVDASKIARFEERAKKEGKISDDDTFSEVGTPEGLDCITPPISTLEDASLPPASPLLLESPHVFDLDSGEPPGASAPAKNRRTAAKRGSYPHEAPTLKPYAHHHAVGRARAAAGRGAVWQVTVVPPPSIFAVPPMLRSPGHLRSMEIARAGVQTFFVRVLQPGPGEQVMDGPSSQDGWEIAEFYSMAETLSACMEASQFGRIKELGLYEKIQDSVDRIVEDKNPILLTCLLQVCCRFVQQKQTRCLEVLLKYIMSKAGMHAGSRPLELLCRSLLEAMEQMPSLLVSSAGLAIEILDRQLAPRHSQTLCAGRGLYSALVSMGDYEGALEVFKRVFNLEAATERQSTDATNLFRFDALTRVVACELAMFRFEEATRRIDEMEAIINAIKAAGQPLIWNIPFWYMECRGELLRLQRAPGACDILEQAYKMALRECKPARWWMISHAEKRLAMATSTDPDAHLTLYPLPS